MRLERKGMGDGDSGGEDQEFVYLSVSPGVSGGLAQGRQAVSHSVWLGRCAHCRVDALLGQ